jgi:sterol desaturase/sphingolipid hydroxylase (fatty acid hydroxylase superfamily)
VVEELGPIRGIRRSWSLMRRRFWPVLGIALLAGLISNVLGQVLGVVPTFAGVIVGLEWGWILVAVGAILTALVTTPIVAIVATLQYFDARIRFEGFDLQVIAAELGPTRVSR